MVSHSLYNNVGTEDSNIPLQVLLRIGSRREVAVRWYEFGLAVGISTDILDGYSSFPPNKAINEVLSCWLKNYKPTWKEVSETLNEVGLSKYTVEPG